MTKAITPAKALKALDAYIMCEERSVAAEYKSQGNGRDSITGARYWQTSVNWSVKAQRHLEIVRRFIESADA